MKHLKITSVLLSAAMCVSFVMAPVGVFADETEAPAETELPEITQAPDMLPEETPFAEETPAA